MESVPDILVANHRAFLRFLEKRVGDRALAEDILQISANNAAVRAFRARQALRKQVRAACATCAEHGCIECTCSSANAHC